MIELEDYRVGNRNVGQKGPQDKVKVHAEAGLATPKRREQDRLDQLAEVRQLKVDAARKVLERFVEAYEQHLLFGCAGLTPDPRWIQQYPEKFVREIEYVEAMRGVGA